MKPNKFMQVNPEVVYTENSMTLVARGDINNLIDLSLRNLRQRVRLCTHTSPEDSLHEMLIVHKRGVYVPPHKHPGKSESMHVIEGVVDLVLFDNDGGIQDVLEMGDYKSGALFFYRMGEPIFHTLIIRSEVLVFHETTNGPFNRVDTKFADWAPEESNTKQVDVFMAETEVKVSEWKELI